jgi:predicted ATPase
MNASDDNPNDLAALDAAWEEVEVTFGPAAAPQYGEDGLTAKLRAALRPAPDKNLQSALSQLVEAGLIFQRGVPPQATYLFKHALVQDATHASLLKSRRHQLHASIARVLEERFPEVATTTEPEWLAHHYTEAGLAEVAVNYWRKAGELAISRSAISEAFAHFGHGLEVLEKLPKDRRRQQTEIQLRLSMGGALMITVGPNQFRDRSAREA